MDALNVRLLSIDLVLRKAGREESNPAASWFSFFFFPSQVVLTSDASLGGYCLCRRVDIIVNEMWALQLLLKDWATAGILAGCISTDTGVKTDNQMSSR